jgi:hypothetical protein
MEIKTYYCFIDIKAKELLKKYTDAFKESTNRSVIVTPAKYKNILSGLTNAQGGDIFESTQLLGFCLTADSSDLSAENILLIEKFGGKVFEKSEEYLNYIDLL